MGEGRDALTSLLSLDAAQPRTDKIEDTLQCGQTLGHPPEVVGFAMVLDAPDLEDALQTPQDRGGHADVPMLRRRHADPVPRLAADAWLPLTRPKQPSASRNPLAQARSKRARVARSIVLIAVRGLTASDRFVWAPAANSRGRALSPDGADRASGLPTFHGT